MSLAIDESLSFDHLVSSGVSFAFFRSPGDTDIHFIAQPEGIISTFRNLEELNGEDGFVVAPFSCDGDIPICLIKPDRYKKFPIPNLEIKQKKVVPSYSSSTSKYDEKFESFRKELDKGRFQKLVLSTEKRVTITSDLALEESFYRACKAYPNSYVYLLHTSLTGVWMGCSPEILLSGRNGSWKTVALAGTQMAKDDDLQPSWDRKNIDEQDYVSSYIRQQLKSVEITASETGPYSVKAGQLLHRRTDFEFELEDKSKLGTLLYLLHPTPAVCGLPKETAFRFIMAHEGYNRRYYSGFVGMLNPEGDTNLYVNLRCMTIEEDELILFAGGGLLAVSCKEEEWMEIEKKLNTMLNII